MQLAPGCGLPTRIPINDGIPETPEHRVAKRRLYELIPENNTEQSALSGIGLHSSPMNPPAGSPWPDGKYGEVHSPSGRRAYLADQAAELAGRTRRWATQLARAGNVVVSERQHIPGRQGAPSWFLLADSFEQYLNGLGLWPPQPPGETSEWRQLLQLQGVDLDAARQEIVDLKRQIEVLTTLNGQLQADRNSLLDLIAKLSEIARTTPAS